MTHLGDVTRFIQEHHERLDGSGYPAGIRGEEISLGGQIVGISEAWVAILESRAYRAGPFARGRNDVAHGARRAVVLARGHAGADRR